jgi:hypothetical protein
MKKLMIVLGVALFTMASCSKDWTCQCKINGQISASSTIKDTKKNAETKCNEGDASVLGVMQDCEIQ